MNDKISDVTGYATLLQELRSTDSETGLLTRTQLYNKLLQELARCDRYGNKLSVVSLRIFGADGAAPNGGSGDLVGKLGNYLGINVRNVDYAARWSDREFLVVLPETDEQGARVFANKVSPVVNGLMEGIQGQQVSIDIAAYVRGDDVPGLLSRVKL
jgi:diguanylate cyclase (GGDEF)-like protein